MRVTGENTAGKVRASEPQYALRLYSKSIGKHWVMNQISVLKDPFGDAVWIMQGWLGDVWVGRWSRLSVRKGSGLDKLQGRDILNRTKRRGVCIWREAAGGIRRRHYSSVLWLWSTFKDYTLYSYLSFRRVFKTQGLRWEDDSPCQMKKEESHQWPAAVLLNMKEFTKSKYKWDPLSTC